MDKEAALTIATEYAAEVCKVLNPLSIILYGSYANETESNESDIDITVIFNDYNGNWLQDSALLWRLTRKVSTTIEPVLLDRAKDPSGFVEDIFKRGRVLYSAEGAI